MIPRPSRFTLFPYTTLFRSFFRGSDAVQGVFGDGRMAAWPSLPDGVEIAHRNRYRLAGIRDRKSTGLNSSHVEISYAVFCLKKKIKILCRVSLFFIIAIYFI